MVKMISLKCPECGAELSVEEGRKQAFCTYCGAKVMMENENEHIYRHIDEAQIKQAEANIKQAETEREIRLRELKMEEQKRKVAGRMTGLKILVTILQLAVGIPITGFGLICMVMCFSGEMRADEMKFIGILGLIAIVVGVSILGCISFVWKPKK